MAGTPEQLAAAAARIQGGLTVARVEAFLQAWESMDDHEVIAGTVRPNGSSVQLKAADVGSLLDEVLELREQLAERIAPVDTTDTVVHLQNPPIDYGLPVDSVVRFATGPDEADYVQVHCDGEWVRIISFPLLDVRPWGHGNGVRVRPARS
jgi:hypothetical protein